MFSASNVELVTRTRTEHLSDSDKKSMSPASPLQSFLNIAEQEEKKLNEDEVSEAIAIVRDCFQFIIERLFFILF